MDELNALPYLEKVVREVLRLHAPVVGTIRAAMEDTIIPVAKPYVDRHGVPARSSGFLRWESRAGAYARCGPHLLLFAPDFVEVRALQSGRLVQVLEGADVRLVARGALQPDQPVLVAMRGRDEGGAVVDTLVELVETSELRPRRRSKTVQGLLWDEWDS